MAGGAAAPSTPRDPRRRYCPECGADITRSCSWFALPMGTSVLTVSVIPEVCPECNAPLRPPPSMVAVPGRPS